MISQLNFSICQRFFEKDGTFPFLRLRSGVIEAYQAPSVNPPEQVFD